jgi:YfiH family protein
MESQTERLPLLPESWGREFPGLVGGFGDRQATPPQDCVGAARQVHGVRIVEVADPDAQPGDCDGLVSTAEGLLVGVRTADCVPVLMVAPGGWIASIHAGWRGTAADIVGAAVIHARKAGIAPERVKVALGPSIGPCCYEVGDEVAEAFLAFGAVRRAPGSRPHVDLRAANRELLLRAGVPAVNVESIGPCTRCHADRYYSYRANPKEAGRQWSWLGWELRTQHMGP